MPRRALSGLALLARGIAEGMVLCTGPVVLLATPTQGFSGTAGPSSLRTLACEQDVSSFFASAYCWDYLRCADKVPRRAMRFCSDVCSRGGLL